MTVEAREAWRADPRAERISEQLRGVVLAAAASRPIGEVSVAEISRRAGISRTTFYKHAPSPAALLKSALTDELLRIRTDVEAILLRGQCDLRELSQIALGAVLAHVRAHESIYRLALSGAGDPELHRLLTDHFRESILLVFRYAHVSAPFEMPSAADANEQMWELFAAFVAGAYVEVITTWLRVTSARSPDTIIEIMIGSLPGWMLNDTAVQPDQQR